MNNREIQDFKACLARVGVVDVTNHAILRMHQRGIDADMVIDAIENHDQMRPRFQNGKTYRQYFRKLDTGRGVSVYVAHDDNVLVTVAWRDRIRPLGDL